MVQWPWQGAMAILYECVLLGLLIFSSRMCNVILYSWKNILCGDFSIASNAVNLLDIVELHREIDCGSCHFIHIDGNIYSNKYRIIHYSSIFVRIKCLINSMHLTKKSFILRNLQSLHSFSAGLFSPNSFYSTNELSRMIFKSGLQNWFLLEH